MVGIKATFCRLVFKTEILLESEPEYIGRTFATARFFILLSRIGGALAFGLLMRVWYIRMLYFSISGLLLATAVGYGLYIRRWCVPVERKK